MSKPYLWWVQRRFNLPEGKAGDGWERTPDATMLFNARVDAQYAVAVMRNDGGWWRGRGTMRIRKVTFILYTLPY